MTAPLDVPYGSWKSPISADLIAIGTVGLGQLALDGEDTYWVESRPTEAGRCVVVQRTPDGELIERTPAPFNARTRVHEYGGGAFASARGVVYFSNFTDQRVYCQDQSRPPLPITPAGGFRYADGVVDHRRDRLVCVREDHSLDGEPGNALVSIPLDGRSPPAVLVGGNDFYAAPRVSPDGMQLAWLTWNHPNMPWDGTELWVGNLAADGRLNGAMRVAGGPDESTVQPQWSPCGTLHFVSERTGWWNLYRWRDGRCEALCEMAAEFGRPQWIFGQSTYAFAAADRIVCSYTQAGRWQLARLDATRRRLEPLPIPHSEVQFVCASRNRVVFCGGSGTEPLSIVEFDLTTQRLEVLRRSSQLAVDVACVSTPQAVEFPTQGARTAHAFFYAPQNPDYTAPPKELPPLLVMSHGGPTAATSTALNLTIQYWTSRGIAVLDVNYGGSTGYGRAYRRRLDGQWGIVDVDDCVNGARYLVERGLVDGNRLAIRGGSAGGYTTLCTLTFRDTFKAGASYYGIADLEALARDTHKFESRYLDRLIGPYPARRALYRARSPLHFAEHLSCPVIFFQGLDDKVVPANQTGAMVAALRAKRLPVAYLPFAGEQHGFRRAETIRRALEAELYFYARVFGFSLADPVEPVPIETFCDT